MGIRTDLTSLGAIGFGTAVAVIGTGAVLFAAVSAGADASPVRTACLAVSAAPPAPAPAAPALEALDAPEASGAPEAPRVRIVVADRIELRAEVEAECLVERIRAEALETGEVDAVQVRELVDAVLVDAGVRR